MEGCPEGVEDSAIDGCGVVGPITGAKVGSTDGANVGAVVVGVLDGTSDGEAVIVNVFVPIKLTKANCTDDNPSKSNKLCD